MPDNVKTRILLHSRWLNVYLVRYSPGHRIASHIDGISRGRLYKLNWVLRKPRRGGEFTCERTIFNFWGRLILFRPDLYAHQVSKIEDGNRWLLSFAVSRG